LLIKVTPLTESVIRLAAPDTYDRLHALAESRRSEAAAATLGVEPELFLVSFFSYEPNVEFQPEDLQLVQRGRLLRARTVLPVTPGWGKQRLQQQETQIAVYAFGEPIDYEQLLVVRYGLEESGGWDRIIRVLEVERAKVRARTPAGMDGGRARGCRPARRGAGRRSGIRARSGSASLADGPHNARLHTRGSPRAAAPRVFPGAARVTVA